MKDIHSTYVLEGGKDEVLAHLSPTRIAEYMNYNVLETKERKSGQYLRVRKYDTEFTLVVRETNEGYQFSQAGSEGPFSVLDGGLQIETAESGEDTETSRVTVDISYTIGSFFSFLLDWLSRRIVERDANSLLDNLARELAEECIEAPEDSGDGTEREQQDAQVEDQESNKEPEAHGRSNPAIEGDQSE